MKTITEMSNGELRNVWLNHRKATMRMAALSEYERRRAEMPAKVRAAFEAAVDLLGVDDALTILAEYMEQRLEKLNEAKALQWVHRVDEIREMVNPSEDEEAYG